MRIASVEILSDTSNAVVLRHPDRKFPGVLIQGDTLHSLCVAADAACRAAKDCLPPDDFGELNDLRNHLRTLLVHYKDVLNSHAVPLPFNERS
jgi:hypothetical protein